MHNHTLHQNKTKIHYSHVIANYAHVHIDLLLQFMHMCIYNTKHYLNNIFCDKLMMSTYAHVHTNISHNTTRIPNQQYANDVIYII